LLDALKEEFPSAGLSVLASETNAPVLLGNPHVDQVYSMSSKNRKSLLGILKEQQFDLLIDPYWEYELAWAMVSRKIHARYTLGFDIFGRGLFYNLRIPAFPPTLPASELMLSLCRKGLSRPFRSREPRIYLQEGEDKKGKKALLETGINPSKAIVLLHPGGYYPEQRWAPECFSTVASALSETGRYETVLVGGKGDEPLLRRAALHWPSSRVIITPSLREFICLLSHAGLLICNNSGPLHLACALKIPTLSTLGPTDRALWAPRGSLHRMIERKKLEDLDEEEVIEQALAMLSMQISTEPPHALTAGRQKGGQI
jgi:ADP-heptose:LPS heptosyltransferase